MKPHYPLLVMYDHACTLCRTEMRRLKLRDREQRLELLDISAPEFAPDSYGFTHTALQAALHVRDARGQWLVGMAAIRAVYRAVGLGALMMPTGWPILRPISDRAYAWLADQRMPVSAWLSRRLGYGLVSVRCDKHACAAAVSTPTDQ